MGLTLTDLLAELAGSRVVDPGSDPSAPLTGVTADSRQAGPGVVFVAVRGSSGDGHAFLADAARNGCAAVVVDEGWAQSGPLPGPGGPVPVIAVPSTRPVPALAARLLAGRPDRDLLTAGVTGTNGKTTVAFLLQGVFGRLQGPCGLLGTIRYQAGDHVESAPLTTPGGPVLYSWLQRMVSAGCRSVALEVSSHALDQQRAAGLQLDVAVMTNLGRDHLDYHRTIEDYLAAKARILDLLRPAACAGGMPGAAVINVGDPALAGLDVRGVPLVRFATGRPVSGARAELQVLEAELTLAGTRLSCDWRGSRLELRSPLVGRYNVENLTAALGAALALGFEPELVLEALGGLSQVPGRMERFPLPAGGLAVVDYAHTHDALAAVLAAADELAAGEVFAVFGCGGDRDRGKRPLMGQVAMAGADRVWITSDNPRSEDPALICEDILAGCDQVPSPRAQSRTVIVDRTSAIRAALAAAGPQDVVVIAGKGHEDYQLIGGRVLHLDDREIVRNWIAGEADHE